MTDTTATTTTKSDLLTITEAAELLRTPVGTLRYWRHLGTGPRSSASAAVCATGATKCSHGCTSKVTVADDRAPPDHRSFGRTPDVAFPGEAPTMASIEKRNRNGRSRWYVRYRDPAGRQRTKVFDRKIDAERYLTTTEAAKLSGSYVDPRRAAVTVGEFAKKWKAAHRLI